MAYHFYLGNMLLPIAPEKFTLKINNANQTYTLINEGEINVLKTPGLTDIEFDAEALLWQTVVNRIVSPSSHLKHYRSQTNWLGNSLAETNLRSLYRMLSFAARIKKPILRGLNKALNQAMPRDLSVVFYDVTNTWFETVWDDEHQWAMEVEKQLSALPSGATS